MRVSVPYHQSDCQSSSLKTGGGPDLACRPWFTSIIAELVHC